MSSRGDAARRHILTAARELFAANGFSGVTMQDICRETGISRGGLYRHYASTGEIFCAIVTQEQAAALAALERAKADELPAEVILETFLDSRLHTLLDAENSIDNAVSEFAASSVEGKTLLIRRAETSLRILTDVISLGCAQGCYHCRKPEAVAAHILWLLEGMAKHNALLPLGSEEVEAQRAIVRHLLRDTAL